MPEVQLGYRERDPERADSFGKLYDAEAFPSADALIEWADVVDICLPTDLHVEYALRVIEAGKPLFLEKPVAGTLEEAQRVVDAANAKGVPFMVGQVVRYFPEYRRAHNLVKSGAVGRPAAIRTRRGGAAPKGSSNWFMDHARSGGVLLDLAIHDFDWLLWTFGEVDYVYSRSVAAQTGFGPDYALTTMTFKSGAVAHVEATWMDPSGFRTTFDIAGSEGVLEYDSRTEATLRTFTTEGSRLESPLDGTDDPYYCELKAFLDAVRQGTPVPVPGEEGVKALALALAALQSARTGEVVHL